MLAARTAVQCWWSAPGFCGIAIPWGWRRLPRTVALVLALASAVLIVRCLMRFQPRRKWAGSHLRRAVLVPAGRMGRLHSITGFFVASLLGFLVCGLTARYEPWPMRRWVGFVALAVAAVALFYGLFSEVLKVPFPRGWLL